MASRTTAQQSAQTRRAESKSVTFASKSALDSVTAPPNYLLQRAIGNRAVSRLLQISRKCQSCEETEDDELEGVAQAKSATGHSDRPPSRETSHLAAIRGGGSPLPLSVRGYFEPRFGYDFSAVRIHTGSAAIESAAAMNARAYTAGSNIVFNSGEYQPTSVSGRNLLAHELAHVVQQGARAGFAIQRRTYRDRFTTVAFVTGPLWNVQLTITNAPEEDTERLEAFILACHDGVMSAARELGERPAVTSRTMRVRIRYNPRLSEADVSQQAYERALASLPRPRTGAGESAQPETRSRSRHIPPDPAEEPRQGESDDQRIRRQIATTVREFSNVVADADAEGYNRVVLNVENDGREIIPGSSKEQPTGSRAGQTSAYTVRETLSVYADEFSRGRGRWRIVFTRQGNAMRFSSFERVPEAPAGRSEEDELRALGIPNRREIYAQIFAETERQLQEAGIMIAGFAIEQLVLWVVGGLLFRALGLVGRAAFPRIMALIQRGTPASLAPGLEALSTTERAEFAALLQRVESGALSAAERTRLASLLSRIEAALPATLTRTAAGALSRIRIPRVTSLTGSARTFDTELVRRAAEIRATQAGLSLEAFTNYNVAVARVRTSSGEIVYLEAGNLPAGAHSEEYILAQLRDRALGLGRGARVEQLYSERIPCTNCSDVIRRFFGEETQIYYTVGNQPNRGRLLMEAYGL